MGAGFLKSIARRVAARVIPGGYVQSSDLASIPLEDLLGHYYAVWLQLHHRVNEVEPNIKLRRHGVFSFSDFVLQHIERAAPVRVLDVGAADCFLDFVLSQEMHKDSTFDCIDVHRSERVYLNSQLTFVQADAVAVLGQAPPPTYDYAVASGFIGLLPPEQKRIVFEGLSGCTHLFVRENPKITSIIDAFCGPQLDRYRPWPHAFAERELKDMLARHGFTIRAMEHEYDVYIFASRSVVS